MSPSGRHSNNEKNVYLGAGLQGYPTEFNVAAIWSACREGGIQD